MKNLEWQRHSSHNSLSFEMEQWALLSTKFQCMDIIEWCNWTGNQKLATAAFSFFAVNPVMWQLTSLLSSYKATLSVDQFIKSISWNKSSIFSSLSTVSLTLLLISTSSFYTLLIFAFFSENVTSLSFTKNLPPLICWYFANRRAIGSLWNLDVKTNS